MGPEDVARSAQDGDILGVQRVTARRLVGHDLVGASHLLGVKFLTQWPRFGIVPNRSVRINLVSRLIEYSHLCGCPKLSVRRRPDFCRDIKPSGSVQLIYLVNLHDVTTAALTTAEIGRASCRERVCQSV